MVTYHKTFARSLANLGTETFLVLLLASSHGHFFGFSSMESKWLSFWDIHILPYWESTVEVPDSLRAIFFSVTAIFALSKLTGLPKHFVVNQWEKNGFGEAYLPIRSLTNPDRRFLVGVLESSGIGLTLAGNSNLRKLGYGLLLITYGRGSLINARMNPWRMFVTGGVALVSILLLRAEVEPYCGEEVTNMRAEP